MGLAAACEDGLQGGQELQRAAVSAREQAVQELALQPRWAFWDLSQCQLLIGSF